MSYERVAIVHDWLTSMRGGERVVEAFFRIFPRADLFTLTWDPARLSPALAQRQATTSAIHRVARAPFVNGRFRALLPFFPLAVESFNLDGYDLVLSSSHCVAIGAIAPPTALHIAYVHSTLRYVREGQPIYESSVPGGHVGRTLFRRTARYLRTWEAAAASRPHELIANSSYTRERIRCYYGRDARVIEPPVETTRFERAAAATPSNGGAPFLIVSALVPNKRVDLALRAFQGRPERLVVVGEGPERRRLQALVGPNVTLLPRVDDTELARLVGGCRALLHPGVDDFGMVMVEALAAGKPVIACAEGGALDIVRDGETGLLIKSPTVDSVRAALDHFARLPRGFDPAVLRRFAHRFDSAHFERRFAEAVDEGFRRRHGAATKNGVNGARNGHRSTVAAASISHPARSGRSWRNGGTQGAPHHDSVADAPRDPGVRPLNVARSAANGSNGSGRRHLPVLSGGTGGAIEIPMSSQNGHAVTDDASMQTVVHRGAVVIQNPAHEEWMAAAATQSVLAPNGAHATRPVIADRVAIPIPTPAQDQRASGVDPLLVQRRLAKHSRTALHIKRLADVVIAASGLVVTAPLVATLGALIALTSPGPALFYQSRTGLHQRPFVLVKLRTMDRQGRVTPMGRLLRPLGLDELPQLWNVLKGDMSVVGPRPELPDLVAEFERNHPGFQMRHLVRPGITGWAQVNGLRGHPRLSIAERLRFDVQYMCEWDLAFDARILARTLSTVLKDTLVSLQE